MRKIRRNIIDVVLALAATSSQATSLNIRDMCMLLRHSRVKIRVKRLVQEVFARSLVKCKAEDYARDPSHINHKRLLIRRL